MSHIFISYARKNKSIALAIKEKLEVAGKTAWVDLEDIHPSSDWKKEINNAILSADAFIYLLSQESIKSPNCREEFETAKKLNKRFFLILLPGILIDDLEEDIAKIHVLDWENVDAKKGFNKLLIDIDTDHEWRDFHTDLLEKAQLWQENNGDSSHLIRGKVLDDTEIQLAQSQNKKPEPVDLQREFVLASRKQTTRTRNSILTISAVVIVVLVFLSGFAFNQRDEATSQAATAQANANIAATAQANAEEQAKIALARQIAAQAQSTFASGNSKIETSVLLAIQSMILFPNIEAEKVIQNSLLSYPISKMKQDTSVDSLAFSPDGKYLVSGEAYGLLHIWDAMTGEAIITLPQEDVGSLSFSSDGKYLVSGGCDEDDIIYYSMSARGICLSGSARIWEIPTGREVSRTTYNGIVSSVDFYQNGEMAVSGGCDQLDENYQCVKGSVRIWEATTGKELVRMVHDGWVLSVKFSPDGNYVVSGSSDMTSRVWNVSTGKEVARMTHLSRVNIVAFSPDGRHVVSGGSDNIAVFWEAFTGREIARVNHEGNVKAVAFSPDGKLVVSASDDTDVRVWDSFTGRTISQMYNDSSINQVPVSFSPDGKYVVSESARVWNAITGEEIAHSNEFQFESVVFSSDGKYIASGDGFGNIQVWRIGSGKEVARISHDDTLSFATFTPDGRYIVSLEPYSKSYNNINVWDMLSEEEVFRKSLDGPNIFDISSDSRYIASAEGYYGDPTNIIVWNTKTGEEILRVKGLDTGMVLSCKFSPDGKYIALGSNQGVMLVLNATTGDEIFRGFHDDAVSTLDFSPDGKHIVSGSSDGTIRVWDFLLGKEILALDLGVSVGHVAYSPNGKYFVSGSFGGTVLVWDYFAGKEATRVIHNDSISTIDISPDGKYVVSGGGNTARVWDIETGRELSRMTHDGSVSSAHFSPDGKYVVSGGDKTARVWLANSGVEVSRITHDSWVVSVAMSSDGKYVVSADQFGSTVRIWLYRPEDIVADACSRVTRNLTRAEWNQYIGNALPYQAACSNLPIDPETIPTP